MKSTPAFGLTAQIRNGTQARSGKSVGSDCEAPGTNGQRPGGPATFLSSEINTSERQKERMCLSPVLQTWENYLENMLGCFLVTESLAILSATQ